MAHRYLVKNGFQLETIDVEAGVFIPARPGPSRAVTLDSVVSVLTTILADPQTGTPQEIVAAQLAALRAIWSTTGVTDIAQAATRGYLQSTSGLLTSTVNDRDSGPMDITLHQTSYKNVLPPRFSEAWKPLSTDNTGLSNEKERSVIKLLEGSFENIKSHASAEEAWAAYNDYIIRGQDDEAETDSRANYLVKP